MASTLRKAAIGTAAALAVSATVYYYSGKDETPPDLPDALIVERIAWEAVPSDSIAVDNITSDAVASDTIGADAASSDAIGSDAVAGEEKSAAPAVAVSQRRFESFAWLTEMRKDIPDRLALDAYKESFAVNAVATKAAVALPPFTTGRIIWTGKEYDVSRLPFPVIDVDPQFDTFALWAQKVAAEQPAQVVIGWESLNNYEQRDLTQYDNYFRQIRATVRMVREVSPNSFIWITAACKSARTSETYKPWLEQVGGLGDGIALFGATYFGIVDRFPAILREVQQDAGTRGPGAPWESKAVQPANKPVMLLGFGGYVFFDPASKKPKDFEARMDAAEKAARKAGFSGFIRMEVQ